MSEAERDDREIEKGLRTILDPLDRYLNLGNFALGFALVVIVPTTFLTLWLSEVTSGKYAAGWAGGAFVIVVIFGVSWDTLIAWRARLQFDRRFPAGHPTRAQALLILNEMETPSKGEERLRESLQAASPERIIRHRRGIAEQELEEGLNPPEPPRPVSPPPIATPPARPGGYYDYIPLEPRSSPPPEEERDRH